MSPSKIDRAPARAPRGYVLAGGGSRRFGRDKARAHLWGEPLIVHAARLLVGVTDEPTVVAARPDQYRDLGLATIADECPGLGPLGGLTTALGHACRRADDGNSADVWIAVTSCDHGGLRRSWVERLVHAVANDADAVVVHDGTRWQPFPGVYRATLLPAATSALTAGRLSVQPLLDTARTIALDLPDGWETAARLDTEDALARFAAQHPRPPRTE